MTRVATKLLTRTLPRLILYLSSYSLLFFMMAIRLWWTKWSLILIVIGVVGVVAMLRYLKQQSDLSGVSYRLTSVREAGPEAASYLATYLLPVVMVGSPGWRDGVIAALFLFAAAAIFLHSSIVQINPTLYMLRYQVVAVESAEGFRGYLITRGMPRPGEVVHASRTGDGDVLYRHQQ
jgi:hypothetical protein